jgi:hypothetical protein
MRMRRVSTLDALCAIDGYKLLPPCSIVGMCHTAVLTIACK